MNTLARTQSTPTLFDAFFGPSFANRPYMTRYAKNTVATPAVNVKDTEAAFLIELAAPGAKKEQFSLLVNQHVLTLTLNNAATTDESKDTYVRHEFGFQPFERSFKLPKTVDVDAIKAAYTDGILTVELPKMAEVQPDVKQITIA